MVTAVTLLSATLALGGFQAAGLGSNHQDIAPRYSGILFGITNATSSIAGCAGIMGTGVCKLCCLPKTRIFPLHNNFLRIQTCAVQPHPCAELRGSAYIPNVS